MDYKSPLCFGSWDYGKKLIYTAKDGSKYQLTMGAKDFLLFCRYLNCLDKEAKKKQKAEAKQKELDTYLKIIKDAQDIVNDQTCEANEILNQYCEMAKELKRN